MENQTGVLNGQWRQCTPEEIEQMILDGIYTRDEVGDGLSVFEADPQQLAEACEMANMAHDFDYLDDSSEEDFYADAYAPDESGANDTLRSDEARDNHVEQTQNEDQNTQNDDQQATNEDYGVIIIIINEDEQATNEVEQAQNEDQHTQNDDQQATNEVQHATNEGQQATNEAERAGSDDHSTGKGMKITMFHDPYHIYLDLANHYGAPKVDTMNGETGHNPFTKKRTAKVVQYDVGVGLQSLAQQPGILNSDDTIQHPNHPPHQNLEQNEQQHNRACPMIWYADNGITGQFTGQEAEDMLPLQPMSHLPLGIQKFVRNEIGDGLQSLSLQPKILDSDKKNEGNEEDSDGEYDDMPPLEA